MAARVARALLRRASSESRSMTPGALCTDATFMRVLGTHGESEPILVDLLSAWRQAQTGDASAAVLNVALHERKVSEGLGMHAKGALFVDVRAAGDDESYLVEVQHRAEAHFPHRAIIYSAAEVVAHHLSHPSALAARRVHTLAFCDYDFTGAPPKPAGGPYSGSLPTTLSHWRRPSSSHERDVARALQVFWLHASPRAMAGRHVNAALERELAAHANFVFALLPHAPRLVDLTHATPSLLRWAALVAHASPDNLSEVPKDVRVGGVARLLDLLDASAFVTRQERFEADRMAAVDAQYLEDQRIEAEAKGRVEGEAKGRFEGKAEGRVEGQAELLRTLGINSAAAFRERFGVEAPPDVAQVLQLRKE